MAFLQQYRFEWWQLLLLIIAFRMYPLFLALATVLVARLVKPDIARIALPLILSRRNVWTPPVAKHGFKGVPHKKDDPTKEPSAE